MVNTSPILRFGYPPVILRGGEEIVLSQKNETIILRNEEVKVQNQLSDNIVRVRSGTHVKLGYSNIILRVTDVGSHTHDTRYYTKAITDTLLSAKVAITDIVNNLTTNDSQKPLSAAQGVVLKGLIDQINTLLTSNDVSLDQLQEIVDYIKANREDIDSLGISSIIGLQSALDGKVPTSRTITINGVTYDLSENRSFTVASSTPVGSNGNVQRAKDGAFYGTEFLDFDETNGDLIAHKNLSSEKVSNGSFTGSATGWTLGTGWAYASNVVSHSSNGTGTLSQNISAVIGELYKVTFTISSLTVGSVTVTLGGITLGTYTSNGTYTVKVRATSTASLIFTPTNTARFTIDTISVKKYQNGSISTGTGFVLQYGSTITSVSPFAYLSYSGMTYYGYGKFNGKIVAGYTGDPNSKFAVNGGMMGGIKFINSQNQTLGDDITYILDPTGNTGCYGTPSTSCGSLGTQGACDAKSYLGCGWVITDYCSNYGYENLYNCNFGPCSPVTTSCSGAGDSTACTNQNTWGGNCAWNYYTQSCSGFDETACNANPGCSPNTSYCSADYFNCSAYTNPGDCSAQSGNGCAPSYYDYCNSYGETDCGNDSNCTKNYFNCSQYNGDETTCNDHSGDGCSYDSGNSTCNGGNFTNCTGNFQACNGGNYIGCSGGAPCSGQSEGTCSSTSYFTSCSGDTSYYTCDGNYNTGECGGGSIGNCGGTASCNGLAESPCNAESGCSYQTAMTTLLPNSTGFYINTGLGLQIATAISKMYEVIVQGTGSVQLTAQGSDKFENGASTKTLSTGSKYLLRFFGIPGNCTDFNSDESGCGSAGCSQNYDEGMSFIGCSGVYTKYKRWYTFTTT